MILFLDFDGVLHPLSRNQPDFVRAPLLAPVLVAFPETEVVLSTSWRTFHDIDALCAFLPPVVAACVVGTTPLEPCRDPEHFTRDMPRWPAREHQCRDWLRDNGREGEQWIVLEDDRDAFSEAAPVIWCEPTTGLNARTIAILAERLSASTQ